MKKTLLIGASTKTDRYANRAANLLLSHGHPIVLFGKDKGNIQGVEIQQNFPSDTDIDTVTLYLNPINQASVEEKILALKPKRILFNPGTENEQLMQKAKEIGIEVEAVCTLVLLTSDQY